MTFIIALIGRSNVGKSMLFNRLTHTRNALVADELGATRDRKYGDMKWHGYTFVLIDTGGINQAKNGIELHINNQSFVAAKEADLILFLVDARLGILEDDYNIIKLLYRFKKNIIVVVNKVDGINVKNVIDNFYVFGIKLIIPISAISGYGIKNLLKKIISVLNIDVYNNYNCNVVKYKSVKYKSITSDVKSLHLQSEPLPIKLAVIGRPNVGKSTFINCISNTERVIVYDVPGTTRDNIHVPVVYGKHQYILIDTPGIRRKGKVSEVMEKFFVTKTLQMISEINVALLILDANDGVTDQDLFLLNFVFSKGKSLVIAVNKWDKLSTNVRRKIKDVIIHRINFVSFVNVHFISALYQIGIHNMMNSILKSYQCSIEPINTGRLTRIVQMAINAHKPPLVYGRRITLKYAHIGGYNPIIIVIHGHLVKNLTCHYKRYLINYFSHSLCVVGNMIKLQFNEISNPFINR
ncbi:ribosome biogenesis GTPase Der [Blochmannia endosymbiont of Camponotus (Colobopsis) obliquus]|uniref:ribosome biogenesis GTPase Der n=1 Tax=Blochmannia endosymbiont of Camponotus (Colobopsis) obliquus TaxID=1505597 RepID=UPI00061A6EDF|nr:ribosome biogenesis GTPase Der [Blochmannia endosymbiont of Camponotus (Colobopsis) obliquus]AKC60676.1 GTPase Der [Blochmannia endosymbiont of Camponotus (Colobopsis) obliquus]